MDDGAPDGGEIVGDGGSQTGEIPPAARATGEPMSGCPPHGAHHQSPVV